MLPLVYDLYNHAFEGFSSSSSCFHLCQKNKQTLLYVRVYKGSQGYSHGRESCCLCGGLGVFSGCDMLVTVIEIVFGFFFVILIDR